VTDAFSSLPSLTDEQRVAEELAALDRAGLRRRLRSVTSPQAALVRVEGREVMNFSSNDYLGLADSEELKDAMIEGVRRFGAGAGASRLVCGNFNAHEALEQTLAQFKGVEAAISFTSGYAAALGTIPALCGKEDVILLDKLAHASLIDAARLSGATLRVFPHHHLGKLERLLAGARQQNTQARVLVVTESIFSMDGDAAPLGEIVELCETHGALLLVDEAHAVGVLGPQGRGAVAQAGLEKRVALQMGTLSKAAGVSGGYIATSRPYADLILNKARSLIYTTAPPPALAFAATKALQLIATAEGEQRRAHLWAIRDRLVGLLGLEKAPFPAAIWPLQVGGEGAAVELSAAMHREGYWIPAIRYPTVARGKARLRLTLSAAHELSQIEALVACLDRLMPQVRTQARGAADEGADEPMTPG